MSQSMREINDRILMLKGSKKLVRAMKVISTARLTPAQRLLFSFRPYATAVYQVIRDVSSEMGVAAPPLMKRSKNLSKLDVIVISSNQGMCGGFNDDLMRNLVRDYNMHKNHGISVNLLVLGKKGASYLRQNSIPFIELPVKLREPSLAKMVALEVSELLCERFLVNECDGSYIVFNKHVSMTQRRYTVWNLLPLHWRGKDRTLKYYVFEPSRDKVLNKFCHLAVESIIMHALLESKAAEEASRLVAMDAAERNANEIETRLHNLFHRARQDGITKELLDIVNGAGESY